MIGHWLKSHWHAFILVLKKLRAAPVGNLLMAGVIGATLSLPAGLYLLAENVRAASGNIAVEPQISLFLALNTPDSAVKALEQKLRGNDAIKDFSFESKESAWQELLRNNSVADVGLEKNPLPDAFLVHPKDTEPQAVDRLQKELSALPNVEHTLLDAEWVKRLYVLLQMSTKAVIVLTSLLGFALVAIIGNTIRLQILTQREEIEVSRLIGATDRFIRRPFLHAGLLHGLAGGLMAWLFVYIALYIFNASVQDLALLYSTDFRLHMLDGQASLILLGGSAALGWLGALLAVNRSLAELKSAMK
jgi:cell division transport system permease protein